MFSVLYFATFVASLILVLRDKDFEIVKEPCIVCMPSNLIVLSLSFLFIGAEVFTLFKTRAVWVISGVMALSISGFMLGIFFAWERHKRELALHQMVYVMAVTMDFYIWWY